MDLSATVKKSSTDDWDVHWSNQNHLAEYNPGQKLRHRVIKELIANAPRSETLLDFGSGQGDMIHTLQSVFSKTKMVGFELSRVGVEISRRLNPKAEFYEADLVNCDQLSSVSHLRESAQVITCCDVLEHIDDPKSVLKCAREFLSDQGTLIVTVPGGPMSEFDRHIGHRKHYTREDLQSLIADAGFSDFEVRCAGWPFFNLYRLMVVSRGAGLSKDVDPSKSSAFKTGLIKVVGLVFIFLMRFSLRHHPDGWLIVATAKK